MPRTRKKSVSEVREDVLRPAPSLGFDHDALGMHLLSLNAFEVSESELRRAIWLNPFEARFKRHLAWCLFREKRYAEAHEWIVKALEQAPEDASSRDLLDLIRAERHGGEGAA